MNDFLLEAGFESRSRNQACRVEPGGLRNLSTLRGREIWAAVDRAANRTPAWIRPEIQAFAKKWADMATTKDAPRRNRVREDSANLQGFVESVKGIDDLAAELKLKTELSVIRRFLDHCLATGFYLFTVSGKTFGLDSRRDLEDIMRAITKADPATIERRFEQAKNHLRLAAKL